MLQCLLNACRIEREVQSSLDGPFPTGTPPGQGTTANVEAKPVKVKPKEEQITFRVFHHDVFKGYQGQGFVDVYDPRWASGRSEFVSHITVGEEATYEELQQKVLSQMGQTEDPTQNLLFIMNGSVQNAPKLDDWSPTTRMQEMRYDHPLRCLWLVTLPSCELAGQIPEFMLTRPTAQAQLRGQPSDNSETIDSSVANDETTPMDVLNPSLDDDSEDVEMEDHQDEVDPEVGPDDGATVTQDGPTDTETSQPSSTERIVTVASSPVERFHESGFIYILLKHYDTERQSLTGLCGIAAKRNEKVKEAVEKILPDLALSKISDASTLTIWKEVGLDNAKVIEPDSTFENEILTSGSIIILQDQPSAEE